MATGDFAEAAVRIIAIACIALPILGIFYILSRLARQFATMMWTRTRGKALQRGTAVAAVAFLLAGLAWAWWPGAETYRPVHASERGTLADATTAIFPASSAGQSMKEGQAGRTVTLVPKDARKPSREEPQLSMVLVPRQTPGKTGQADAAGTPATAAPSWVFPFDKPAAPPDGGNQALAVNTKDGSVVYDVAFALVWADDGANVRNTNEAYAFASCKDCAAVAVGFQVVLIVGQTNVIVPENLSAAANYTCVRCLTYALASQLVLTLDGPLSTDSMTKLNALWQQISEYGRNLRNVPLTEIQDRLSAFKAQIADLIKADPGATKATSPGTATTPGAPTPPTPGNTTPPGATEPPAPTGATSPPLSNPAPAPNPSLPTNPTPGPLQPTSPPIVLVPANGASRPITTAPRELPNVNQHDLSPEGRPVSLPTARGAVSRL